MAKIVKPDLTYQWASAAGGGSVEYFGAGGGGGAPIGSGGTSGDSIATNTTQV